MKQLLPLLVVLTLLGAKFGAAQEEATILAGFDLDNPAATTWGLPKELKDISGLALTPDGRLFALEQERAIIHEIDFVQGTLVKTFTFGRPAAKKDFSAIAIAGKRFFVINQKGVLLEGREGFNGEGKVFNTFDTGFGRICKVQGLAAWEDTLLALCGAVEDKTYRGFLTVLSWDIAAKTAGEEPYLKVPWGGEDFPPELSKFSPSGLEVLDNGNLIALSNDKKIVVELSPSGTILGWRYLNKKSHDEPVGLAFTEDGKIIIADQGNPAWISVYGGPGPAQP